MDALRTPDERFDGLPGWPFAPRYLTVGDGLRMHYVDEGPADGRQVFLLHGEPSWGYLYRKMIPVLAAAGLRAIVPDLIGFGRSDKPIERSDYTYQRHVDWVKELVAKLDLRGATLVCQDWGGLIGLRIVAEEPERWAGVVAANTFLPTGNEPVSNAFRRWRAFSQETPRFHAGGIVKGACATELPAEVIAAYDAPFPDDRYLAGARQFPMLVPITPDDPAAAANRAAWQSLMRFERPFLTAFSDGDPITRGGDLFLQAAIPGARGQQHTTIRGAAHFLQEDRGEELARVVVDFLRAMP